jgi:transposase
MGKSRKHWSADLKLKIIKEAQTSGASISEVCRRHAITTSQYYQWLNIVEQAAREALNGARREKPAQKEERMRRELDRMKSVIAEITAENLELKKSLGE